MQLTSGNACNKKINNANVLAFGLLWPNIKLSILYFSFYFCSFPSHRCIIGTQWRPWCWNPTYPAAVDRPSVLSGYVAINVNNQCFWHKWLGELPRIKYGITRSLGALRFYLEALRASWLGPLRFSGTRAVWPKILMGEQCSLSI